MKSILVLAFTSLACLAPMPEYVAADPEPEVCSGEDYPFETAPEACESDSFGTCCTWGPVATDGGYCTHDYCTYHEDDCQWHLTHVECGT